MSRPTVERVEGTVITLGGVERTVFAGDVVCNGMHACLADGRLDEWIATLTRLRLELRPDARRDAVVARMHRLLPTDDLAFLMELSIEPVLAGLR